MKRIRSLGKFIEISNIVHSKKYDYSKSVYQKSTIPLIIICPIHGEFSQKPMNHLRGSGCNKCGESTVLLKARNRGLRRKENGENVVCDINTFIKKSEEVHGNKYDYSRVVYKSQRDKVEIVCRDHGPFFQVVRSHIKGFGCKKCSIGGSVIRALQSKALSGKVTDLPAFIERAKEIHEDKYDYSDSSYTTSKSRTKISCPIHGEFFQSIDKHLAGQGCKKCNQHNSKLEAEMSEYLNEINVNHTRGTRWGEDRFKYELDIFIPELKIGIEMNGCFFHSSRRKERNYHKDKRIFFEKLGIKVIFIWEDEWNEKRDVIKNYLRTHLLKDNIKIFARKCAIKEIDNKTSDRFLNTHHILGSGSNCNTILGLFYEGELVSIMSFRYGFNNWELHRMVTKSGLTVVGGFSKLLNAWRNNNPEKVLTSYIDLDKFDGLAYFKSGFKFVKEGMTLSYFWKGTRHSKYKFRHDKLKIILKDYDPSLTEKENCHNHGIYQVWNSGTISVKLDSLL